MKLLLCKACDKITTLKIIEWTVCDCGLSRARYLANGSNAEIEGDPAAMLAISNTCLQECLEYAELAEAARVTKINSWDAFKMDCCVLTWDSSVVKRLADNGSHLCYLAAHRTNLPAKKLVAQLKSHLGLCRLKLYDWLQGRIEYHSKLCRPFLKEETNDN